MPGQSGGVLRHEAQVQMNAHLPVTALPQMSLPVRAKGMHAACIKHIKSHDESCILSYTHSTVRTIHSQEHDNISY